MARCLKLGLVFTMIWAASAFGAAETKPSRKIAILQLRGRYSEAPRGLSLSLAGEPRGTMHELLKRFDKAAKDVDVAAVALYIDDPTLGWAQVQEVRAAIGRIRAAGKEVHGHFAAADETTYLAAAACNRVAMVPSGQISLTGVAAQGLYFKGLLDKLGIVADMEHVGAYKGAAEPYTRTGPSAESQEQMRSLMGDLYQQLVEGIATSRDLSPDAVRSLIDRGPFTARQAAAAKLVDELSYRDEFVRDLKKRFPGAELLRNYGRQKGPEVDLASPFAFLKLLKDAMEPTRKRDKNTIALVYIDGVIWSGASQETFFDEALAGSTTLRRALMEAAEDDSIKAVVLRIDSPGGSALASDMIYQAIQIVRKAGKPVITSMGNTAASGGYYTGVGADTVFAQAGTITGSIGVVGGKIALGGLFDKVGITTYTYKFGQNSDLYSYTTPFDERQRQVIRVHMGETYDQFKRCVVDRRGDRLKGDIEDLAGGRVYTGRQAMAKGLVDRVGGLDDALRYAAGQAKLTDYSVRIMPKPRTLFDYIRDAFGFEDDDDQSSARADVLLSWMRPGDAGLSAAIPVFGQLAPNAARSAVRSLLRIDLLRHESVLMITPMDWTVR